MEGGIERGTGSAGVVIGKSVNVGSDPFIENEDDPAKCNALASSLWEIKVRPLSLFLSLSRISYNVRPCNNIIVPR